MLIHPPVCCKYEENDKSTKLFCTNAVLGLGRTCKTIFSSNVFKNLQSLCISKTLSDLGYVCRSGRASFYAGTKSLFIFKKGFSQLTYKDVLQNGGETGENNRNPT